MKFLMALALTVLAVSAHASRGEPDLGNRINRSEDRINDRRDRREERRDRRDDRRGGESVTCTMVTPNYRFTSTRYSCRAAHQDVLDDCLRVAYSRRGSDREQTIARCNRAGYDDSKYRVDCYSSRGGGDMFPYYCR